MADSSAPTFDRRTLLTALAGAGTAGLAGCSALTDRGSDADTTEVDPDIASDLATQFAPTLYFDEAEPWPPTDPRPYATEADGETVVDGFDALNGYHERLDETGEPPNRTVFYNVAGYEDSPLSVVQFWMYSAFDQFTANFHWHDWEVLHVFVDTNTEEAQLYVASSHSTRIPNNEFLDPEPDPAPRILSELGSHSSALSVNDQPDEFQRLPGADLLADITNTAIEGIESLSEIPLAYGLPRDEGGRLPYVVPEYEGQPVYDHERLPAVDRESLINGSITVRTLDDLATPPTDLPERSTGMVFRHEDREAAEEGETDYAYDLVPTSELEDITDFSGPQLSFEFAVPQFAEDAISGHISTAGVPWEQPRYDNPADDITDPNHRAALAERYDAIGAAAAINTVVASIGEAVAADDAPEGEGLTTQEPTVEAVSLLESESRMIPTFRGVAVARDVPEGDHRLTVNAAGQAPYSERLAVGGDDGGTGTGEAPTADADTETGTTGTVTPGSETTDTVGTEGSDGADETARAERVTAAGVDAEIPLVARENARKLEVDADGTDADLAGVAVEDDFAGRLYDSPTEGSDAVYVHRGGAYTTEVRDTDGELGAFRVNPDPGGGSDDGDDDGSGGDGPPGGPPIRIDRPETGKASLSSFLVEIAKETRNQAQAIVDEGDLQGKANGLRGLVRSLDAVIEAAERATENARAGNRGNTDQQLRAVEAGIERVVSRLDAIGEEVPEPFQNAVRNRADQAAKRATQAQAAEKL